MSSEKVQYVVHPVTQEQKAKLRAGGKIIDARFAPDDKKVIDADGKEVKKPKA